MVITIKTQFGLILYSLSAGVLTGILFDIYRIIRGIKSPNKIITFIEDILFWILTAIIIFTFLLYTHSTYLSAYVYLCILLGVYLYIKLISKYFLSFQRILLKNLGKVLRIFKNIILFPFKLVIYGKNKRKYKINKK
jgi:spore cortex biosynthesis protein YabQ